MELLKSSSTERFIKGRNIYYKMAKRLTLKKKNEIADKWIKDNGCASFDLKGEEIIFHDGGGFCIEKEIKYLPRHRWRPIKEGRFKGGAELVNIKGPKVKHEFYTSHYSFCDLDDHINFLRRMKKMLNSLGYETSSPWKRGKRLEAIKKWERTIKGGSEKDSIANLQKKGGQDK